MSERSDRASAGRGLARLVCGPRSKWVVIVLWIAAMVVAAPLAQKLNGAEKNDASSWLPGAAESTKVVQLEKSFRPETAPALVIYARASGLTPADRAKIAHDAAAFRSMTRYGTLGGQTVGPIPDRATNPRAEQLLVPIKLTPTGWNDISKAADAMRDTVKGAPPGLQAHVTGAGGYAADQAKAFQGIDSTLLFAALGVVVLVLLFAYRSPTLLLVPIVAVVTALFGAEAMVYLCARHAGLTVNGQSAGILTVLVFGAGTDYALLLVARYREELRRHADRHEAMALALHRAGPALIASAGTVAVSMLCLLLAEMNSTASLGPVLAIGVAVALLAMLTLFPAVLVAVGRWIFWPLVPHRGSAEPTETGLWARIGGRIRHRPRTVWITTALVLGVFALGLTGLDAKGLSTADSFTNTPDSVTGQRVSDRYFPAGTGSPLVITSDAAAAARVRAVVQADRGIVPGTVGTPRGVPAVRGGVAYQEGTLKDAPDGAAAKATVERLRAAVHAVPRADARIGGGAAVQLDINNASNHDNKVIIPVVLVAVLAILALLLRALIAPLLLVATVVLSFAASLGVSAEAFRHVFGFKGEDTSFPLFVFVFLVALGVDYNIFLVTRIREESARRGTRDGAVKGLAATGGVITSAGLVLAGTFAVLATLPIVGFAEIGSAVAFGVLLDTFVVRSVLVCALLLDVGPGVWWPRVVDPPVPRAAAETT